MCGFSGLGVKVLPPIAALQECNFSDTVPVMTILYMTFMGRVTECEY